MLYTNSNIQQLPNIVQLRAMLLDALRRYPVLHRKPYEQEIPDRDKYVVTPLISGRYSLKPNITQQGLLFHGSKRAYQNFKPNLFQVERPNFLLENVRREALLITMESYPLYRLLMDGIIVGNSRKFCVHNPYGLVACYGHKTPFIQLTSDLDTAIMYAITDSKRDGIRKYLDYQVESVGVLYVFELNNVFGMIKGLSTLGLQAFERSGRLNEFLFQMLPDMNFNELKQVKGFTFRHDEDVEKVLVNQIRRPRLTDILSKKIANLFDCREDKQHLPINALHRNTKDNNLTISREKENEKLLKDEISFDGDISDFRFNESDLADVCLESKWFQLCSKLIPIIPSDRVIIDTLMRVPENPLYSKYFCKEQWFDSISKKKR